jgi:hypothetical protein
MKPEPKQTNPAHVGLPKRPAGLYKQYQHSDTEAEVTASFLARLGYAPEVVQLVDTSITSNPNPCWIAGPVKSAIEIITSETTHTEGE